MLKKTLSKFKKNKKLDDGNNDKNLNKYSLEELHQIAKHYLISSYETMSKEELIERIETIIYPDSQKNVKLSEKQKTKNSIKIKINWKFYFPVIILSFLLGFEFITFIDPIISHFVFPNQTTVHNQIGVMRSLSRMVNGKDWGFVTGLSFFSFIWTSFIFYQLIKSNSFNYLFFISILMGASYFFYYLFREFKVFSEVQSFINQNNNLTINGNLKEMLNYYWIILGLSIVLFSIPTILVVVNLIFKNAFF